MMKKIVIAALLTVVTAAGFAYVYDYVMYVYGRHLMDGSPMTDSGMIGGAYACPMADWTVSTAGEGENKKFLDNTVLLRQQLNDAEFSYYEARRDPNTVPERLQALEKEISELQEGLREQARLVYR